MIVCSQGERLEAAALFERRQVRSLHGESSTGLAIESPKESREQTAVRCGSETSRSGVAQVRPGSAIRLQRTGDAQVWCIFRQAERLPYRFVREQRHLNSGFFLGGAMLNSKFAMASPAKKAEISFETAMERLEKIVEEMESGKMLLEDLLVRYEEGMKLVKVCQDRLAHAEQKIQIITRDHAGKTSVKDFPTTEPPIASTVTDSMKENDDVRLF
jgi:exodeoxyribonuclease VII small subunit